MKFFIALLFAVFFPLFIFLTTILYTPDITSLLKSDLVKNNVYHQLSNQLGTINTSDVNSAFLGQFIQNKFTSDYLQQKIEKAINDSDDWITGKSQIPPVISFKDVRDDLNTQYPQFIPTIEQAAEQMKQEESQNPQLQQNSQTANELILIDNLAKSDFTIPLSKYLVGLKDFYTIVRIMQPLIGILLVLGLVLQFTLNKIWRLRFKWIGITLMLGSIWGYLLTYTTGILLSTATKYLVTNTNHAVQLASPIALQLINHYVAAYSSYQKPASIALFIAALGCFIGVFVTKNNTTNQGQSANPIKK